MDVKIVAFEEKYAESLSVMWNASSAGWNGSDMSFSVETIISNEKKAHVNTNLALIGDKVVGYCNLENNRIPGAYYIGLLNVLPSMHGKKIGKKLILKAIEKTIEDKIERLDLHTWSGNTLAVPLYKKTGFLWRRSADGVHLVNYIPFLLTHDFFKPYFAKIDWYKDRADEIIVEPDGHELNNFYIYEYNWKNEKEEVTVVFEDNGKSVCGFECQDFSVSISLEKMRLPIAKNHLAKVTISSKSGKALALKVTGLSNDYVDLSKETSFTVENTKVIDLPFTLKPKDEQYSKLPHKPRAGCNIEIDGRVLPLGLGVEPTYPVELKLESSKGLLPKDSNRELLLFCKNNLEEDIEIELDFSAITAICRDKLTLQIGKREEVKSSLSIVADQTWAGEFKIPVTFIKSGTKTEVPLDFNIFVLNDAKLAEYSNFIKLSSRDRSFNLQKSNKFTHAIYNNNTAILLSPPLIGEGLINEFSASGPLHTEIISEENIVREEFASKIYPNLLFIRKTSFPNNEVRVLWSVCNKGREEYEEIEFSQGFKFHPSYQLCYKNGIFTHSEKQNAELKAENLSEPWILLKNENYTTLVKFSGHDNIITVDCEWNLMKKIAKLKVNEEVELFSIDYYFNLFYDYQNVRRFFYNKTNFLTEINVFNLENKKGNPIYDIDTDKELNFSIESDEIEDGTVTCNKSQLKFSCNDKEGILPAVNKVGLNKHELNFFLKSTHFKESKYFIGFKNGEINHLEKDGILTVDNSILEFKSHAGSHPGIFSLKFQGKEILDISYPQPQPRGWYNPWYGGISYSDSFNGQGRLMDQKSQQEYVEVSDNFKNKWRGIKISTTYHKKDDWKDGYTLNQYYLTLPNSPVFVCFANLDFTDKLLDNNHYFALSLYTGVGDLSDYTTEALIAGKYYKKHYCGSKLNEFESKVVKISHKNDFSFISFSTNKKEDTLVFDSDSILSVDKYIQLERLHSSDNQQNFPIQFFIFTDDFPEYEELSKINQLSIKV